MSAIPQQNKPVYQGTTQNYDKLPQSVKQYYQRPPEPTTQVYGVTYGTKTQPQPLTKQQDTARVFYSKVGKPELSQKGYAAPQIPEGYEATEVKEVHPPQVYGVTYGTKEQPQPQQPYVETTIQQKPSPKSIGEQIASVSPSDIGLGIAEAVTGKKATPKQVEAIKGFEKVLPSGIPGVKGTPTEVLGGFVAAPESLVYGVGRLIGVEGLPQPPTVVGGLVGSGVQSVMAGAPTATRELEYVSEHPAYAVGTLMGDIALSYATGKVVGYGIKTYKTIAPKVNVLAEKALGKATQAVKPTAWKVYEKGYQVIEPTWRAFSRVDSTITAADTKLASLYHHGLVSPLKYNVAEPIISGVLRGKAEVSTVLSRTADVAMRPIAKFSPQTYSFVHGVVAANIMQPQKYIAPTLGYYKAKYVTPTTNYVSEKTVGTRKLLTELTSVGRQRMTETKLLVKNVLIPDTKSRIVRYATPPIREIPEHQLAEQALRRVYAAEAKARAAQDLIKIRQSLTDVTTKIKAVPQPLVKELKTVTAPMVKELTVQKTMLEWQAKTAYDVLLKSEAQTAKALGVVAMGKARYALRLKTPQQQIRKTPLIFTTPEQKQTKKQIQALKYKGKPIEVSTQKQSTMVSGMPTQSKPYPGTQRARIREIEETVFLTKPGEKLRLEKEQKTITFPLVSVDITPKMAFRPIETRLNITKENLSSITKPKTFPTVIPKPLQDVTSFTDLSYKVEQTQKQFQEQIPKYREATTTTTKLGLPPLFGAGGGGDLAGGRRYGKGLWRRRVHPIPTPEEVTNNLLGKRRRKR